MNRTARKFLKQHLERTDFNNLDDYVVATKSGGNCNTKNMQSSLSLIIKNAHIKVEATNTHIMRHTCATLLYNNGVDLHSISKILGDQISRGDQNNNSSSLPSTLFKIFGQGFKKCFAQVDKVISPRQRIDTIPSHITMLKDCLSVFSRNRRDISQLLYIWTE